MQISSLSANHQAQTLSSNSRVEGSPAEEANESAAERASEAQQRAAVAKSTGVGTKIDVSA